MDILPDWRTFGPRLSCPWLIVFALARMLAAILVSACAPQDKAVVHTPIRVDERQPTPDGRRGAYAFWPDGTVTLIEWGGTSK